MPLKKLTSFSAGDHVLDLAWSADGSRLAVTPSTGNFLIMGKDGALLQELPGHGLSNGIGTWNQNTLVTCGADGKFRLHDLFGTLPLREIHLGKTWIEHAKWSPDGTHLAVGVGKTLHIFDSQGEPVAAFSGHKSTIADFAWNPQNSREISCVCDGGAHMWRLGETQPFGHFDWGGASLIVAWSPDGRWLVTGDQTPSVHLYDFTRQHPLHIQGYETKVKALSFNATSTRLATGGGPLVTVWDCTGPDGPEGSVPNQIQGHAKDSISLAFHPTDDLLASGGQEGLLILFQPEKRTTAVGLEKIKSAVTSVAWHPEGTLLAVGTEDGSGHLFSYLTS